MIDYCQDDEITLDAPDGSSHVYRVVLAEPIPGEPNGLSLTLSRVSSAPRVNPSESAPVALAAASGSVIGVVPLAQKLAEYRLAAANAGDGVLGLMIGHDPCVWHQVVSSRLEVRLPHVIALALEHHLAGCRVPR
jgi:hypothetical protein